MVSLQIWCVKSYLDAQKLWYAKCHFLHTSNNMQKKKKNKVCNSEDGLIKNASCPAYLEQYAKEEEQTM